MTDTFAYPRPDFVMVGGQHEGKVFLIASRTLTDVELRTECERDRDRFAYLHGLPMSPPRHRHYVTAEMKDLIEVVADSYPEAFQILFEQWSPGGQRELPGQEAIGM